MIIKNKKGSHVGVVISFIAFVTFVILLFSILRPSTVLENKEKPVFNYLKFKILDNVTDNLFGITVNLEQSISGNCIELSGLLTDFGIQKRVVVRNQEDVFSSSEFTNSNGLQITRISSSDDFFKIYSSDAFDLSNTGSTSCQVLTEGSDFTFGATTNENYVFEKRVMELISQYDNYDILKDNFNVPEGSNFGFGLIYNNGTSLETSMTNVTKNIFVGNIPIEYVDNFGGIDSGFLKIVVW